MGSSAPNVPSNSKLSNADAKSGNDVNLVCTAQAFPVPYFRYGNFKLHVGKITIKLLISGHKFAKGI